MTELLERAFTAAAKLSPEEQDLLAMRLLEELSAEDAFDQTIARSSEKLSRLAMEALHEHRAGQTDEMVPGEL